MITHTGKSTLIAVLKRFDPDVESYGRASWDLFRCDVTGLFFKFGHQSRDYEPPRDPPHRIYLRKREVAHLLNYYADDI